MNQYYNIYEEYRLRHYQLPKVFFTNERYLKMSNDSKIAWAILRDRFTLSVNNNWYDDDGNIFFIFTNVELKKILQVGNTKLSNIKKELQKNNLLEQKRTGQGKPNKLYLKKPIVTKSDIYQIKQNEETSDIPWESNDVPKWDFKKSGFETSRNPKTRCLDVPKTDANDTDINDTDINDTDINLNLNRLNKYIWNLKLPMGLKKFLAEEVKVLVKDPSFDIYEVEYFYNTYSHYINPNCTRDEDDYLNDLEFVKVVKKIYEKHDRPIRNMESVLKTWVQQALHYKKTNKLDLMYMQDVNK